MSHITDRANPDQIQWLENEIQSVITVWTHEHKGVDYWLPPLAAVASARDGLFEELRRVIDPEHALPSDLLASARSVIVFFIPFREWLGEENGRSGGFAARSWAEAYPETNRLIAAVNLHLKDVLCKEGHLSATTPATHNFDEEKLISGWSHKHLAYIAGLGTFGSHHLLITRAGCCGRLGSLVTSMELTPTVRPRAEFCLLKAGYRCSACYAKCKYGALSEGGFDRHACYRQCLVNDKHYGDLPLVDVCGKCGCDVPCSHGIPAPPAASAEHASV
ncbi:MAG: hypothetical protein LLG06_18230 [Desulfobacteraceae bacterium]|nr:hypothetical protein [Desulfobacteraceae bacterium]